MRFQFTMKKKNFGSLTMPDYYVQSPGTCSRITLMDTFDLLTFSYLLTWTEINLENVNFRNMYFLKKLFDTHPNLKSRKNPNNNNNSLPLKKQVHKYVSAVILTKFLIYSDIILHCFPRSSILLQIFQKWVNTYINSIQEAFI